MKKIVLHLLILSMLILSTGLAMGQGYPWSNHAAPFDFLFGNHIDDHQQSREIANGGLQGFLYIEFTGAFQNGYPVAVHGQEAVGWIVDAVPISAVFLGHLPGEHPQWCVNPADLPRELGYSHFHWKDASEHADGLTQGNAYDGFLMKLTATDSFFFNAFGGIVVTPGIDTYNHLNITISSGC